MPQIVDRNGRKLSSHPSPDGFHNTKYYAVNDTGDVMYTVQLAMQAVLNEETGEVTIEVNSRSITQYLIATGDTRVFLIDESISTRDLRNMLDFYILVDNLVVIMSLDRETYELTQRSLQLTPGQLDATILATRKLILRGLTHEVHVGMGLLSSGRVLILGSHGPLDGEKDVAALSISADPRGHNLRPDEDLTRHISEFASFIRTIDAGLRLFSAGVFWDKEGLTFLVKGENGVLMSSMVGRCLFHWHPPQLKCFMKDITAGHLKYADGVFSHHIVAVSQRGRQAWLSISPPDYPKMTSLRWTIYLKWLPYLLRVMTFLLDMTIRMRRWDRGISLNAYLWLLQKCYGPSMIPQITEPPLFHLYNLDLSNLMIKKIEYKAPLAYTPRLYIPYYPVVADCDGEGSLVLTEMPTNEAKIPLNIFHFPTPHQPQTLGKLSFQNAQRMFPSLANSGELRRLIGQGPPTW